MSDLTPKMADFVLAMLETGNACNSYRGAYRAEGMSQRTVEKRASELLRHPAVAERLAALRAAAADKAVLSRAWILDRLQRNARIALGEEKIKIAVRPKDKDEVIELEITARDGAVANRALELLGKTDEVRLFVERLEATGADGKDLIPEETALTKLEMARQIAYALREGAKAARELEAAAAAEKSAQKHEDKS
jgi:hypothetical protein